MSGITYKDFLDLKEWMEECQDLQPSDIRLQFSEADRIEYLSVSDIDFLLGEVVNTEDVCYVYNRTYNYLKDIGFEYLDKLEVVDQPIPKGCWK